MWVFTEGAVSECEYIAALKRLRPVVSNTTLRIEVAPDHGRDPLTLVRNAIAKAADSEVDQCWCLFDVEWPNHHAHLGDARSAAERNKKVQVAISNPCFELWLILHTRMQTQFLDSDAAAHESKQLDGHRGKHIDASWYMPRLIQAVENAAALDAWHERNGTAFPEDNPSSGMYRFVQAIGATRKDPAR